MMKIYTVWIVILITGLMTYSSWNSNKAEDRERWIKAQAECRTMLPDFECNLKLGSTFNKRPSTF